MSSLPFNVAYLDVNDEMRENYSMTPSTYGGGRIVAASLLDRFDNFHIYGPKECFKEVRKEKLKQCFTLKDWERRGMREGSQVYLENKYQLVVHHFSNIHLNTDISQCHWSVGYGEPVHPLNEHVLLFDKDNQAPRFQSSNHKIYDVVIGPRMPEFQEYKKEDFIFCCGRLTPTYQSIQIAQLARKYEIPVVFSGPIDRDYPFLDYLSDYASYLGVVDHATKMEYNRRAKMTVQLMNYPISVTLSCKEAMSVGVIPITTPVGEYRTFIKHQHNGFLITSEDRFVQAWENRDSVKQRDCFDSVQKYSESQMIDSFIRSFKSILHA
jgi:hypothetical protein